MIKQKLVLEDVVGERSYALEIYANSPLGEIHDVLSRMKSVVIQEMIKSEKKANEPKQEG